MGTILTSLTKLLTGSFLSGLESRPYRPPKTRHPIFTYTDNGDVLDRTHTEPAPWEKILPQSFFDDWEGFKDLPPEEHERQYQVIRGFIWSCLKYKLTFDDGLNLIHKHAHKIPDYDFHKHDDNLRFVLITLPGELRRKEIEREQFEEELRNNREKYDEKLQQLTDAQTERYRRFAVLLPKLMSDIDQLIKDNIPTPPDHGLYMGTVPRILLTHHPKKLIADIVYRLTTTRIEESYFLPIETEYEPLRRHVFAQAPTIFRNLGIAAEDKEAYLKPAQSNLDPVSLLNLCFKDTSFGADLMAPIELRIPHQKRFEHWHILAKTGHGKTQTLHNIIHQDITSPEPPSLIIIEPKGDIIEPLSRLKLFEEYPERLSIIDPVKKPALNFFALPERIKSYPPETRALIVGKIAEAYSQALASADTEITPPQRNALNNVVRLVFSISGTIRDLLDILDDYPSKTKDVSALENSRFRPQIEQLDEWAIRFFRTQFYEGQFSISRRSLSSKLQNIIGSFLPFGEIFGANENKLDLYEAMETPGSVVLINTNKGILGEYASKLFGRLMVAQTMTAALQRGFLRSKKTPCYLIVDEAQDYFDESFQTILEQCRSVNVGLIFAHHDLNQIARFRSTALGQPSIKLAAPENDDLETMAATMNTPPDLLRNLPTGHFGLAVRGQPTVPLRVTFGTLKAQPQMSDPAHYRLLEDNARRFAPSPPIPAFVFQHLEDTIMPPSLNEPLSHPVSPGRKQLPDAD